MAPTEWLDNRAVLKSQDLQRFIDGHRVDAVILSLDRHTPTVSDAAIALGVDAAQIIKTLVFIVKDNPLLVIGNGRARIDRRKLAEHLSIGRRWVKLAAAEQALAITGYVVGSMPPFGHKQQLRTVIDSAVKEMKIVFGGGGDINAMMRLASDELLRVTTAEIADISERP